MENFEKIKHPEINAENLLSFIDSIQWEQGYEFSYNGSNFLLDITDAETVARGQAGLPAEYFKSTAIDGWDIYLHDTIPEAERKRVLFHEILEANLKDQGFSKNAHQLALKEEQKIFGEREEKK